MSRDWPIGKQGKYKKYRGTVNAFRGSNRKKPPLGKGGGAGLSVGYLRIPRADRRAQQIPAEEMGMYKAGRKTLQQMAKDLHKAIQNIADVTPVALLYATYPIFERSQIYVPVDTGLLKSSGFHQIIGYKRPKVLVGYARGNRPWYAMRVHEVYEWEHEPPTRAGYLRDAYLLESPKVLPRLQMYLKRAAGLRS